MAPLSRFRVLDLSRVRSGPTAAKQLGDWGADVIRIEAPEGSEFDGVRTGADFQNLHRGKRSLTLNLKHPEGVSILKRLVATADVLIENYRPDVKGRLGIDYESLRAINPRLVYASISGFGETGPYALRPGFDQIVQGMGGLMSVTGLPGQGPVRAGIPVADLSAGLFCAFGILVALLEREVSGEGQWVTTSLLEAQIAMMDFQAARWLMDKAVAGQVGNDHPTMSPMGVYPTSDGFINIASAGDAMWKALCGAVGLRHLVADPDFSDDSQRLKNKSRLRELLSGALMRETSETWIERLNAAGVPCGPIYAMDQVFADPQVQHLGIARAVTSAALGERMVVGQAVRLSRTPDSIGIGAPEKGEQSDDILRAIGISAEKISELKKDRII